MSTWNREAGVIEFPDGRRVRGTSIRRPRGTVVNPQFAVYLLGRTPEPPAWEHRWVRWPDFGRPTSTPSAIEALREAHERAASERVEICCGGGVGRTGTAIALLATMSGIAPEDAVAWVRAHYHARAVETPWQRRWLRRAAQHVARG